MTTGGDRSTARPPGSGAAPSITHELWFAAPAGSPLRSVALTLDPQGTLLRVRLDPPPLRATPQPAPPLPGDAQAEITAYLAGRLKRFTLAWRLPPALSSFRQDVLGTVARIPFGDTLGYGEVAALSGHPRAARAVGGAMAANPLPLVIPCHRVLAAAGRLGGFTGGIGIKRALLAHEGRARYR